MITIANDIGCEPRATSHDFYGSGIDEPVIMINVSGETETKYYYHYDGLGSVIALSDSSKNIVEKYSYDVFGTTTIRNAQGAVISTSEYGNIYMFTGRQYDVKASIYYYRARFYLPAMGRFLQPDPVMPYMQLAAAGSAYNGKIPGQFLSGPALQNYLRTDPIGKFLAKDPAGRFLIAQVYGIDAKLNLYTYCGNNPIMLLDPYGESWIGVAGVIIGGFGYAIKSPVIMVIGGLMVGYDIYDELAHTPERAVKPLEKPTDDLNDRAREDMGGDDLYPNRNCKR